MRPDLDQVVRSSRDESSHWRWVLSRRLRTGELGWENGRTPGDGVDAKAVCFEDGVGEGVVLEGQDGHVAVAAGCCEVASSLGRRPGHEVDRGGVVRELVDPLPLAVLLAPDQDAAIV